MYQRKLPADPSSLILGIVALCMAIILGCCGFSIIGLILSIIGLISANKSLREYQLNPNAYLPNSRQNVSTAKVLNIIALVLNGIITFIFLGYLIVYGTFMFSSIRKELNKSKTDTISYDSDEYEWDQQAEEDTIYNYQDSLSQE
jgi:hypothetical protein